MDNGLMSAVLYQQRSDLLRSPDLFWRDDKCPPSETQSLMARLIASFFSAKSLTPK